MKTALAPRFSWRTAIVCGVLCFSLALPLPAQTLPKAKPEEVGLSSERLLRINEVIQRYIDSHQISGAVTLVARKGRIAHYEAHGLLDIEAKHPNQEMLLNRVYFSGAAGLVSTAEDYFHFAQMLANGGQLNGKRLLSPRTVELMSSNHTGEMFPGQLGRPVGMGFGFTVEVVVDPIKADARRSVASFGWDGAFGTHFWVDPKEKLVAVLMIQTANRGLHRDFENAVMQAIVE